MGSSGPRSGVTLGDTMGVFEALDRRSTPLTTGEVAAELGCSRRAVRPLLEQLVERGTLETREAGDRTRVWWRPSESEAVAERAERERELERYERIVETVQDGVYTVDDDCRFGIVNEAYAEMTGYPREELRGAPLSKVVDEETIATLRDVEQELASGERETAKVEVDLRTAEGETIRAEATFALHSEDGYTRVGVVRDVTDCVERERALEESERRYRALVEAFPNGTVVLFDEDLRYTVVEGRIFDDLAIEPQDLKGHTPREVFPDDVSQALESAYRAALDGEDGSVELEYADRHWAVQTTPIRDDEGDVFAGMAIAQDVTEREARKRELQRYETIAETASDGIVTIDEESTIQSVNPAFEDIFGYAPEELRGESLTVLMPESLRERHWTGIQQYLDTGERRLDWEYIELPGLHRDGSEIPLSISFSEYEYDGECFFTGIIRDNTEQKAYERELESRARQQNAVSELGRSALENSDLDALFEKASRLVADVLDNDYCKVLDLDPDEEELLLRQGVGWREGIVGEATVSSVENDSQASYTLLSEEPVVVEDLDSETRFSGPDLLTSHDVKSGISTIIGSKEEPWGILGTHDTERKSFTDEDVAFVQSVANILAEAIHRHTYQDELEDLVEQLEESNERLEGFASMLAHELRNPVTVGQLYSQQLPDDANSSAVEYVTEAFDRIEDMIDTMLVLARGQEAVGRTNSVDLATAAQEAWEGVNTGGATLEVAVDYTIGADETYIRHLFRNLFENAVEHGGGDVTVTVGELPSGFFVADDGRGIPSEERDAVFQAGYTTAAGEGGTGLGLSFVEEVAEAYGWECTVVESAAGGAQFEFRNVGSESSA